jgi:hypothetical protein
VTKERLFGEVSLPQAIRSDNGGPFGSPGAGGLSRLSAWLLRLGIDVHFIPPASPQDPFSLKDGAGTSACTASSVEEEFG